jgi:hypothetical protein
MVSNRRQGNEWIISIRDNGIGIDPDRANDVFQIFKRLHSQEQYPGTGIGLAVCKRIVERHRGRIWVQANEGARGTTFSFSLPVAADTTTTNAVPEPKWPEQEAEAEAAATAAAAAAAATAAKEPDPVLDFVIRRA